MIRIIIGILAFVLLVFGACMYFIQPDTNPVAMGMMIRVGAMLGVVCLAYPQLASLKGRLPAILIVLGIICLVVAAARPSLGRILITVVTVAVTVGGILKWMSKLTDGDSPPKN